MKTQITNFKGMCPSISNRSLPDGMASKAVNCNLFNSDLASFNDIGNPFQLTKSATINTIFKLAITGGPFWYQWMQSEVAYGTNIDVAYAAIAQNTEYRTLITGLSGGPQQTNQYYSTDPSQRGSKAVGAYPYNLFPLGLANPTTAPTVKNTTTPTGTTEIREYLAPISVNNAIIVNGGANYVVGDILTLNGPATFTGLPGSQIQVTEVITDPTMGTLGTITGIGIYENGFYPISTVFTGTYTTTGGTGTGATFTATGQQIATPTPSGLNPQTYNNNAGSYINWSSVPASGWLNNATGQGDLSLCFATDILSFLSAQSFTMSLDAEGIPAPESSAENPDTVMYFLGQNTGGSGGRNTNLVGPAVVLSINNNSFALFNTISGTNGGYPTGSIVDSVTPSSTILANTFYRITISGVAQTNSATPGFVVTATVAKQSTPGTILATVSGFVQYSGEYYGFGMNHFNAGNNGNDVNFQNYYVTCTQAPNSVTGEETSYVFTYVTNKGLPAPNPPTFPINPIVEESGPSPPSDLILASINTTLTPNTLNPIAVTIPGAPTGEYIAYINIYRLVNLGGTNEQYEFVAQVPFSASPQVYVDTILDQNLGNALTTENYAPPNNDLQGIISMPNGISAAFDTNSLYLSTPNFPHSWPVANTYSTAETIVAIAAIDTTVLVLTQGHPYTAFGGSDAGSYTMSEETSIQGCVSKRSVASHKNWGVVYASGNGLVYYRGQGNLGLIQSAMGCPYFTYEQWQQLNPSSIQAVVHDDCYWFWGTDVNGNKYGYILDLRVNDSAPVGKFGLVEVDFHITSSFVDPLTDGLYFTPDNSVYPINGSVISAASNIVSQWEGNTSAVREKTWERDEYLMPYPVVMKFCQVNAEDFNEVNVTVACENGTQFTGAVANPLPFIMAPNIGRRYSVIISGDSSVNTFLICESEGALYAQQ